MKEERFFHVPKASEHDELPEEEAIHALRVLRLQTGDPITLIDGEGSFHRAEVSEANKKHCYYRILQSIPQTPSWCGKLHLAVAPTKNIERMEWLVEKATEIGLDEISFLQCQFSERTQIRIDRMEKIIISAVKQSRKAWVPKVNMMMDFNHFITTVKDEQKLICHCYSDDNGNNFDNKVNLFKTLRRGSDAVVMIGPEGDFSVEEVKRALGCGFRSVSLGSSRLRTETAALVAVHTFNLVNEIHVD